MTNITQQQYEQLKEIMDNIIIKAAGLKKIEGEYEVSENMRQFNEMKTMLDNNSDIDTLIEIERDMADFIEVRFNGYLDNPKSDLDNEVAELMSRYLEQSSLFTDAL